MPVRKFSLLVVLAALVVGVISFALDPMASRAANEAALPASEATAGTDEVTALFNVSSEQPKLLANTYRNQDWRIFSNTQLAYLKSNFVLQSALRAEDVQSLPLIQSQSDPVRWLQSQLQVGFYPNTEMMYIQLRGDAADRPQLRKIVDAVCNAYLKEVVFAEEQRRLVIRDALNRSYTSLNNEIRDKMDTHNALASDLGFADQDGKSRILQDIDLKRLDRIDAELLRLENEQLAAKIYSEQEKGSISSKERAQLTFYETRIKELRLQQAVLETRIAKRNQSSVELTISAQELAQLQEIAREMSLKLEAMDVEAVAPDRVRLIQKAT